MAVRQLVSVEEFPPGISTACANKLLNRLAQRIDYPISCLLDSD